MAGLHEEIDVERAHGDLVIATSVFVDAGVGSLVGLCRRLWRRSAGLCGDWIWISGGEGRGKDRGKGSRPSVSGDLV